MRMDNSSKVKALIKKGVAIPNPDSIEIGNDVVLEKISGEGTVIYSGCKIYGNSTLILHGAKIGQEGPVTIDNCQVGPQVDLKGGFFRNAVFLKKASLGFGSYVREGTILEEEANVAHTVGLKQTILFPFVTLGSLINFCDCLMSGGTSLKNHSEVGSSYVHFNYTPNQDKATPSLIGDVPRGVMLNQLPIFLGGQGGLVGPCRLEFGTVIAAGSTYRKDELKPGRLIFTAGGKGGSVPFIPGIHYDIKRKVLNNIVYIANLMALFQWYMHVRSLFNSRDFPDALYDGLVEKLSMAIDERITKLKFFSQKMLDSARTFTAVVKENASSPVLQQKKELYERWTDLEAYFKEHPNREGQMSLRDPFLEKTNSGITVSGKEYISVIKGLKPNDTELGTLWLQGIVDGIVDEALKIMPSFR
jgi:bifunctional UDP-N-acetylglucosamine pyrophosphorylase/glucosamine-1-phosphate N-acetyltransferase